MECGGLRRQGTEEKRRVFAAAHPEASRRPSAEAVGRALRLDSESVRASAEAAAVASTEPDQIPAARDAEAAD